MLDIHVGIRAEDVDGFQRILAREFEPGFLEVAVDKREWNTWGPHKVQKSDDVREGDILAVTMTTQSPMVVINYLVVKLGVFLNALDDPDSGFHGRFIIVTDHAIWNQYYLELCYPD